MAATAWAAPQQPCRITGRVLDQQGAPVSKARVEVIGSAAAIVTDTEGRFCIVDMAPDGSPVRLLFTAERFSPLASDPLRISAPPLILDVRLRPLLRDQVIVRGRSDDMLSVATSASAGAVSAAELASRPVLRSADLLEAVPGVAMTQHSTGGHAPLILLRGYNLDHGTDFATFLEGVPLNLPSHAHAQGYTDLNFLISELIDRVTFAKGPYGAAVGNFGTAGTSTIEMKRGLEGPLVVVDAGNFSQLRVLGAGSVRSRGGELLAAGDASHTDGPSTRPDDFTRLRGMLRYSPDDTSKGWTASLFAYRATWFGSDGYPVRAADQDWISRYGSLDPTDGGQTSRYLGTLRRQWSTASSLTTADVFGQYYDLDLFSNLTFHTVDAALGDQIHQRDRRFTTGGALTHARSAAFAGRRIELSGGVQLRHDRVHQQLINTVGRVPSAKQDDFGIVTPAISGDVTSHELAVSPFAEVRIPVTTWMRATAGGRVDVFRFVASVPGQPSPGADWAGVASPKASVAFGPWKKTEIYANAGAGFHSNHVAGVVLNDATPLVHTVGSEIGVRTAIVPRLQSSIAFWGIDSDSELVYLPEAGVTVASRPGRRTGVEWLNFWQARPWLAVDADLAFSTARFTTDPDSIGTRIPGAVTDVYSIGVTMTGVRGWSASVRGRYIGSRPLIEDGSVESSPSFVLNTQIGRRIGRWEVALEGFNLLNRHYDDIVYYFATRLRDPRTGVLEPAALPDFVTHPAEPRSVRVRLRIPF
jgi:hypothetical protein